MDEKSNRVRAPDDERREAVAWLRGVLGSIVQSVVKRSQIGRLPVQKDIVEREVCALALASYTPLGGEFYSNARCLLNDCDHPKHPLVEYQVALEGGQKSQLKTLDTYLTGGRYGKWLDERLEEVRRWLGLDTPRFHIRYSERTPEWDTLWRNIFTGGA